MPQVNEISWFYVGLLFVLLFYSFLIMIFYMTFSGYGRGKNFALNMFSFSLMI